MQRNSRLSNRVAIVASAAAVVANTAGVQATVVDGGLYTIEFSTELTAMNLNAYGVYLPLGGADAASPDGYRWMQTDLHVAEAAGRVSAGTAVGQVYAPGGQPQLGDPVWVQSFFDVFFDVTVTDVDPAFNFGGYPDGVAPTSKLIPNMGPAHMDASGGEGYMANYDPDAPFFGLLPPPQLSPYIGHFKIIIPLGFDANEDGLEDAIKFTLATHTVNGVTKTWIDPSNGQSYDEMDTDLGLEGGIMNLVDANDPTKDPPFGPITLTGPTTGTAKLIPEVSSWAVTAALGLLGFGVWRRLQG